MPEKPPERRRWRWLRREAIDLSDVVVQIIAVVIGILLALFINNWVTQRQQEATVNDALRAIRVELVANRTALRNNATAWFELATQLMNSPGDRDQSPRPCYLWNPWQAPGAASLTDAAYQTAIATRALAHMPFKQAHLVAQVYGDQRGYANAFTLNQRIMYMRPNPLDLCINQAENFGGYDHRLSDRYTTLIGPDKTRWPTRPPSPFAQAKSSK